MPFIKLTQRNGRIRIAHSQDRQSYVIRDGRILSLPWFPEHEQARAECAATLADSSLSAQSQVFLAGVILRGAEGGAHV